MIPLGINNKTYTNSKTRYRTNFIKILTIKKLFRIHAKQLFCFIYSRYLQDSSKMDQKKHPLKYNKPPSKLSPLS